MRRFIWFLLLLLLTSCASQTVPPAGQSTLSGGVRPTQTVLWQDTFKSIVGTLPDPAKWAVSKGGSGWGNKQLQYYTSNVAQDGHGNLVITAQNATQYLSCWYGTCLYTSARITTQRRMSFTYGQLDATLSLPVGKGIWSAFWIVGANCGGQGTPVCGEIDIAESKGDGTVIGAIHGRKFNEYIPYGSFAGSFHTYTLQWTPSSINLLVDGVSHVTVTKAHLGTNWVFNHPFVIILDVAVGGNWPGNPDATTVFPQKLRLHEIRLTSL